jgi:hypothetical protein
MSKRIKIPDSNPTTSFELSSIKQIAKGADGSLIKNLSCTPVFFDQRATNLSLLAE